MTRFFVAVFDDDADNDGDVADGEEEEDDDSSSDCCGDGRGGYAADNVNFDGCSRWLLKLEIDTPDL